MMSRNAMTRGVESTTWALGVTFSGDKAFGGAEDVSVGCSAS